MKKIVLIYILLNSCLIFSQVGIGTTSPEASLHIKNISNDSIVLYAQGNDGNNKFKVAENGTIYISEPLYNIDISNWITYSLNILP